MRAYDVVHTVQDLRGLEWSERRSSSGTSGMLLKSRTGEGSSMVFYKLSSFDEYRGIYGHECVNEIVASRLMELLGIEHLRYRLIHADILVGNREYRTWLNSSRNFRKTGERKQAFDMFYSLHRQGEESPWEFAERLGWRERVEQMMLVDFLIANRDRHGANIEVLRGRDGSFRMAPLFDNGLSLLFSCFGDESKVVAFDPMMDVQANNFIGSHSLMFNIEHFDVRPQVRSLELGDRDALLCGLEGVLGERHLEAIWKMVWTRWQWYERFCNRR